MSTLFGVPIIYNWNIPKGTMLKYDRNVLLCGGNHFPNEVIELHPEDGVSFLSSLGLFNNALDLLGKNIHYKIDNRVYERLL